MVNSRARVLYEMENGFGPGPHLNVVSLPPVIHLSNYSIDKFLFLAGLEKICATFFVETGDYVLESVNGVLPNTLPQKLLCFC